MPVDDHLKCYLCGAYDPQYDHVGDPSECIAYLRSTVAFMEQRMQAIELRLAAMEDDHS